MTQDRKYAVVTGASTGIGREIAIKLANQGAVVVLVARSADKLNQTKKLIEDVGGKSDVYVTDLSKVEEINKLISSILGKTNHVDVLVNVAGIWHGKDTVFADTDFDKFSQDVVVDTLMVGTVAPTLLTHGLIPLMASGSKIINISGTFENGAKYT